MNGYNWNNAYLPQGEAMICLEWHTCTPECNGETPGTTWTHHSEWHRKTWNDTESFQVSSSRRPEMSQKPQWAAVEHLGFHRVTPVNESSIWYNTEPPSEHQWKPEMMQSHSNELQWDTWNDVMPPSEKWHTTEMMQYLPRKQQWVTYDETEPPRGATVWQVGWCWTTK